MLWSQCRGDSGRRIGATGLDPTTIRIRPGSGPARAVSWFDVDKEGSPMGSGSVGLGIAIRREGFEVVAGAVASGVVTGVAEVLDRVDPGDGHGRLIGRAGRTYAIRDLLRLVPEARRLADLAAIRALVEPVLGS